MNLRVQIVHKLLRDGDWKNVSDVMNPLMVTDAEDVKIACERVTLELSLGSTGLITNSLVGERCVISSCLVTVSLFDLRFYLIVLSYRNCLPGCLWFRPPSRLATQRCDGIWESFSVLPSLEAFL